MASTTPGRNIPSRTSQLARKPPSSSVTCASRRTCGPSERIHTGSPNTERTRAENNSPKPTAEVYTIGAITWLPRLRLISRKISSADQSECRMLPCILSETARMRSSTVCSWETSTVTSTEELKSPTTRSISGRICCRWNSGTFNRKRDSVVKEPMASAKAVARQAAGVTPLSCAWCSSAARCRSSRNKCRRCGRTECAGTPV